LRGVREVLLIIVSSEGAAEEDATMAMAMSAADQAIKGLRITVDAGVIAVDDGDDCWLCEESEWDAAIERLASVAQHDDEVDAYNALCHAVNGPVASVSGSSRGLAGDVERLVRRALAAELIESGKSYGYPEVRS
jgi:hypothetical protein